MFFILSSQKQHVEAAEVLFLLLRQGKGFISFCCNRTYFILWETSCVTQYSLLHLLHYSFPICAFIFSDKIFFLHYRGNESGQIIPPLNLPW
ncbi:hypothetical protein XENTR_v10020224 [Xenopus tropicalis]|nr:hypothetical protein XENTR_v10020224 [Xenopus tropicalis]